MGRSPGKDSQGLSKQQSDDQFLLIFYHPVYVLHLKCGLFLCPPVLNCISFPPHNLNLLPLILMILFSHISTHKYFLQPGLYHPGHINLYYFLRLVLPSSPKPLWPQALHQYGNQFGAVVLNLVDNPTEIDAYCQVISDVDLNNQTTTSTLQFPFVWNSFCR